MFHPGCVKYLKDIVRISNDEVICCDNITSQVSHVLNDVVDASTTETGSNISTDETLVTKEDSFSSAYENVDSVLIENRYLKKLILEKDRHLSSLLDKVKFLHKHITILEQLSNSSYHQPLPVRDGKHNNTHHQVKTVAADKALDRPGKNANANNITRATNCGKPDVNSQLISNNNNKSRTKADASTSNPEDGNPVNPPTLSRNSNTEWQRVAKKKNNKSTNVVGTNTNSVPGITAVPKKAHIFVSRCDPATRPDAFINMLKGKFPEIECETVPSKHTDIYTSFKITVNTENYTDAMSPANWPSGLHVTRFFFRRQGTAKDIDKQK